MSYNSTNKSDLQKLSKAELINLLLNQKPIVIHEANPSKGRLQYPTIVHPKKVQFAQTKTFIPKGTIHQPVLTSRGKVKKLVDFFERKALPQPPTDWLNDMDSKVAITQRKKALKEHTVSFEIDIKNHQDPLQQLQNTRKAVAYHLIHLLSSMKGLKYVETRKSTYIKITDGEINIKQPIFSAHLTQC